MDIIRWFFFWRGGGISYVKNGFSEKVLFKDLYCRKFFLFVYSVFVEIKWILLLLINIFLFKL